MHPKRRSLRRQVGFTIIEILIAIAVITIAIFGTIAAIGFGLRASDLGKTNTFAIGINRKVLELILGGTYQLPNSNFTGGALASDGSDYTKAYGQTPWKPLLYSGGSVINTWFKPADFGYPDDTTAEAQKFIEQAKQYELHINIAPVSSDTSKVDSRLNQITVTTRWRDKTGWKHIETIAYQ